MRGLTLEFYPPPVTRGQVTSAEAMRALCKGVSSAVHMRAGAAKLVGKWSLDVSRAEVSNAAFARAEQQDVDAAVWR
jgi:hypothetical protein